MATFIVIVDEVGIHYKSANNEDFCQMIVINNITKEDLITVGFL